MKPNLPSPQSLFPKYSPDAHTHTHTQVELTSHNALGCIFKILPRYKVRSVGDEVRYNDQIKFESVKTEGQFLHCSASEYRNRFTVLQDRCVCLSTQGIVIRQYTSAHSNVSSEVRGHTEYCSASGLVQ